VCPGFSSDCLETIEEIGVENREYFEESGGERYEYIEALNSDDAHLTMLFNVIKDNLKGWDLDSSKTNNYEQRNTLAKNLGSDT
jgi:ferrochelatase